MSVGVAESEMNGNFALSCCLLALCKVFCSFPDEFGHLIYKRLVLYLIH